MDQREGIVGHGPLGKEYLERRVRIVLVHLKLMESTFTSRMETAIVPEALLVIPMRTSFVSNVIIFARHARPCNILAVGQPVGDIFGL